MKNSFARTLLVGALALALPFAGILAQQGTALTQEQRDQRWQMEKELESIAIIERKVMMPMRDGVRLATDIYRPKNATGKVPVIWVRTPYNFNFWDVRNGVPADMKNVLTAVQRGYAYVIQNERGIFSPKEITTFSVHPAPTEWMQWRGSLLSRGRTARWERRAALRLRNIKWALPRWVILHTRR